MKQYLLLFESVQAFLSLPVETTLWPPSLCVGFVWGHSSGWPLHAWAVPHIPPDVKSRNKFKSKHAGSNRAYNCQFSDLSYLIVNITVSRQLIQFNRISAVIIMQLIQLLLKFSTDYKQFMNSWILQMHFLSPEIFKSYNIGTVAFHFYK